MIYDSWTPPYVVSSRVIPIWDTHPLFTFALWFPLGPNKVTHLMGIYQYVSICVDETLKCWRDGNKGANKDASAIKSPLEDVKKTY
jgi:hypothetical protein